MISALVTIFIVAIIAGLLYYLAGWLPLPPPFKKIAQAVVLVGFVLIVIVVLLQFVKLPA